MLPAAPGTPCHWHTFSPLCPAACLLELLLTMCWLKKVLEAGHPAGVKPPTGPAIVPGTLTVLMSTGKKEATGGAPESASSTPALRGSHSWEQWRHNKGL